MIDLFSNIFTNKILGTAMDSAFGSGAQGAAGGPIPSYNPFRTSSLDMPMIMSSDAGTPQDIAMANFQLNPYWDNRLFGENSYTNITLLGLNA